MATPVSSSQSVFIFLGVVDGSGFTFFWTYVVRFALYFAAIFISSCITITPIPKPDQSIFFLFFFLCLYLCELLTLSF